MEKIFDYHLILETIISYFVSAKNFFLDIEKKQYSVGLVPKLHHLYSGKLKSIVYNSLNKSDTLILLAKSDKNKKIFVQNGFSKVFMGKKWKKSKEIVSVLDKFDFVEFGDYNFGRIHEELPYISLLTNYKKLVFVEIGDGFKNEKFFDIFLKVGKFADIVFLSDFYDGKDVSKKMNLDIMNKNFLMENNHFILNLFLFFSNKMDLKPDVLGSINGLDVDIKKDAGIICMMF